MGGCKQENPGVQKEGISFAHYYILPRYQNKQVITKEDGTERRLKARIANFSDLDFKMETD